MCLYLVYAYIVFPFFFLVWTYLQTKKTIRKNIYVVSLRIEFDYIYFLCLLFSCILIYIFSPFFSLHFSFFIFIFVVVDGFFFMNVVHIVNISIMLFVSLVWMLNSTFYIGGNLAQQRFHRISGHFSSSSSFFAFCAFAQGIQSYFGTFGTCSSSIYNSIVINT